MKRKSEFSSPSRERKSEEEERNATHNDYDFCLLSVFIFFHGMHKKNNNLRRRMEVGEISMIVDEISGIIDNKSLIEKGTTDLQTV